MLEKESPFAYPLESIAKEFCDTEESQKPGYDEFVLHPAITHLLINQDLNTLEEIGMFLPYTGTVELHDQQKGKRLAARHFIESINKDYRTEIVANLIVNKDPVLRLWSDQDKRYLFDLALSKEMAKATGLLDDWRREDVYYGPQIKRKDIEAEQNAHLNKLTNARNRLGLRTSPTPSVYRR